MFVQDKGDYTFQITAVELVETAAYNARLRGPDPYKKVDKWQVRAHLLGTSNPEREGEPVQVVFFANPVTMLAYTSQKTNQQVESTWYKLLRGLGFPISDHMEFSEINPRAIVGVYGRGTLDHKQTQKGEIIGVMNIDTITPVTDTTQREANHEAEKELFVAVPI